MIVLRKQSGKSCRASSMELGEKHGKSGVPFKEGHGIDCWSKVKLKSVNSGEKFEGKESHTDNELEHT